MFHNYITRKTVTEVWGPVLATCLPGKTQLQLKRKVCILADWKMKQKRQILNSAGQKGGSTNQTFAIKIPDKKKGVKTSKPYVTLSSSHHFE